MSRPWIEKYEPLSRNEIQYVIHVPVSWLVISKKPRLFWWLVQLAFRSLSFDKGLR